MKQRRILGKIAFFAMIALLSFLFFSCGFVIKEKIIYEVDGSGTATISYTDKYGNNTMMSNQTLPWFKPLYYLFDEEVELENVRLQVTASSPVTATITWDR
jgi:hypothetical protein